MILKIKYCAVRHKILVETRTAGHVTSRTGRNVVVDCDFYPYFIPKGIYIETISANFKTALI
jgi:hypothetical protein